MTKHTSGLHHFHARKRIHKRHEPYPHPDRLKKFMDKAIYFIGAFGPIMAIPQLVKIWVEKNAAGVYCNLMGKLSCHCCVLAHIWDNAQGKTYNIHLFCMDRAGDLYHNRDIVVRIGEFLILRLQYSEKKSKHLY